MSALPIKELLAQLQAAIEAETMKWPPRFGQVSSTKKQPSVTDLRKTCSQNGIRWRNANGKNQHLNKAQMLSLLSQKEELETP